MKKILVVHYSQTGQLSRVLAALLKPLESYKQQNSNEVVIDYLNIEPEHQYPFPWPFFRFFNYFPESVYMQPQQINPIDSKFISNDYDLVVLGYTVWFLSPSQPITAFIKSKEAEQIFNNTATVTVIACRGMWLMAQEKMKKQLRCLKARLLDNVVFVDDCGSYMSFLSTPLWMFTGKKQPLKWIPAAGVSEKEITQASRFGDVIVKHIEHSESGFTKTMFKGMGAVKINEKLIMSEKLGHRSFLLWGKLVMKAGQISPLLRSIVLRFYIVFLFLIILLVVPITVVVKKILSPFMKKSILRDKHYFSLPSGE